MTKYKVQEGMISNMKYLKSCRNCLRGRPISFTGDVLCKYKGVVSADFVCLRHKYIPELKDYKELNYKCIDCVNFSVCKDLHVQNSSVGLCKLFSVRPYDGMQKNVCSKFLIKADNRVPQSDLKEPIGIMQVNRKKEVLHY